jgi:hypothetical protein
VLSVNVSYAIPALTQYGRVVKGALGGWTLTGTSIGTTGAPFSPSCASTAPFPLNDPSLSGGGHRCQETADPRAFTQSFESNFNTAAFGMPATGSWGNTGLGIFRQPSTINLDLSVDKSFNAGERLKFRLRAQAFNVLNHTQFNAIGSTYTFNATGANTNTQTGQYTGTLQPRQIALTLRAEF